MVYNTVLTYHVVYIQTSLTLGLIIVVNKMLCYCSCFIDFIWHVKILVIWMYIHLLLITLYGNVWAIISRNVYKFGLGIDIDTSMITQNCCFNEVRYVPYGTPNVCAELLFLLDIESYLFMFSLKNLIIQKICSINDFQIVLHKHKCWSCIAVDNFHKTSFENLQNEARVKGQGH